MEAKSYNKEANFDKKKAACKTLNSYILLEFLLITFKEINENKYLALVPTNQSKEKLKYLKNWQIKLEI